MVSELTVYNVSTPFHLLYERFLFVLHAASRKTEASQATEAQGEGILFLMTFRTKVLIALNS